jgi:hypothetical protein
MLDQEVQLQASGHIQSGEGFNVKRASACEVSEPSGGKNSAADGPGEAPSGLLFASFAKQPKAGPLKRLKALQPSEKQPQHSASLMKGG